ncbi:MAG TPA: efflux RND transporter periplasmic adaptor subunit [Bacteroidales bacterium]|nr:efflux RND transporter periplasmic adaptor subunit [Bacteroidales bacterium]
MRIKIFHLNRKEIIQKIKEYYILVLSVLVVGLFLGWVFFHSSGETIITSSNIDVHDEHNHDNEIATIWTCSMHPQIRMDEPVKCPICGMDLIPLNTLSSDEEQSDPNAIVMTESAAKLAEVQTMIVKKGVPEKSIYLQGKIHADERNIAELTARFGGRIEKLFINFTGQYVQKGEKLATIYSPELVTAQRELLEAVSYKDSRPALYTAAKGKLKLWDLSDEQISAIEQLGEPQLYFEINSPITGTITMRHVALGDYVKEGIALFQVVDLSHVWVLFDAYESDLPWIKKGDQAEFSIQSLPGKTFSGKVTFIDPFINGSTRVAKVRVELNNPKLEIKPEMFVNGTIQSKIAEGSNEVLIPKSSILWTGKRAVVYVKVPDRENPTFIYRQITLGPEAGNFYVVADGLAEGEDIATNGTFKIDAAAQLQGLPSMMNPDGGITNTMPGMDMSGDDANSKKGVKNSQSPRGSIEITGKTNVSMDFIMQLNKVYDQYIVLKNAFVQSDANKVKQAAQSVQMALTKVNMKLLTGNQMTKWMDESAILNQEIKLIASETNIEDQRSAFITFNDNFYNSVKAFGLMGKTVYYQFCPMANNSKGAYWLSETKDIRNPYYGEAMLTCGETKETLKY